MKLVKIKNSIFVIFFASIIFSSSVIGVFLYNQPSQENSANKKDNSENDGNQPILQLNLSTLSMKNNQDRKWDENDENTYLHREDYGDIDFIQTDHGDNNHGDNSDCYIEESDDTVRIHVDDPGTETIKITKLTNDKIIISSRLHCPMMFKR